jgi:histone deacetylase 1/2
MRPGSLAINWRWLVNALSPDVLAHVVGLETSAKVWKALNDHVAAKSKTRIQQLRSALNDTRKNDLSAGKYFAKMKSIVSELASAGKPLDDDELVYYVLHGLGTRYNSLRTAVRANPNTSLADLPGQVQEFDHENKPEDPGFISSANVAKRDTRPRQDDRRRRSDVRPRQDDHPRQDRPRQDYRYDDRQDRPRQDYRYDNRQDCPRCYHDDDRQDRPHCYDDDRQDHRFDGGRCHQDRRPTPYVNTTCQICNINGHSARDCWWRHGDDHHGDDRPAQGDCGNRGANFASHGVDTNWYYDTGATDHITGELNKLTTHEPYTGSDNVHTAEGTCMSISHVGHSVLRTPHNSFHLNAILHVPNASKNLLSVHHFTLDNHVFIEFHPFFFLIKDQETRRILFRGPCYGGLYPLMPISTASSKHAFITIKSPSSTWHHRLGHPSSFVVQQVLRRNKIAYTPEVTPYICDSCQLAKSHQLPYPITTSRSTVPLEQVFSDVWGPAPLSVGKHAYYVSFIDDFSNFTWIYLLKKRSDVYQVFLNFQQYVERKFARKIVTLQTNWGGEYEKLHAFFQKCGISHHVFCRHAHQQNGSAERKHHHIVEVGLALLANASMPLKYWDEAFLTVTFLINLLPSKVINLESPAEQFLHVTPNYDALRTFGCACWPNLRPYNTRKLAFRSMRCVFLGYSPLHKGVKCLDVSTGHVYISRDVVFDKKCLSLCSPSSQCWCSSQERNSLVTHIST